MSVDKVFSKATKKSNIKILSNLMLQTIDNDNIVYFQALVEKVKSSVNSFSPNIYHCYHVINNSVNKEYLELFGDEVNLHKGVIYKYAEIDDVVERNNKIVEEMKKNGGYRGKDYELVNVGIYKDKKVAKLLMEKVDNNQPFISSTLTINHNNREEDIASEIISKRLMSNDSKYVCNHDNDISIYKLMTFNNAPSSRFYVTQTRCNISTIDRASKELLWFSLFYELVLQQDNEIKLHEIVKNKDFVNKVYDRANSGIFDYNDYTPLLLKLFTEMFPFNVVNTVKKRDILAKLNKNDIINIFNSIIPYEGNSYSKISFNNDEYNVSLKSNTPDSEDILNRWFNSVKGDYIVGINERNFVNVLSVIDMNNRVKMFEEYKDKDGLINLDQPSLISSSYIMENHYDSQFTTDKKKLSFMRVLDTIGIDNVKNEMKLSELLLLQNIFSLNNFLPGKLTTDQTEKLMKQYIEYKKEKNISNTVFFNFLFDLCDNIKDVNNAYKTYMNNNFLEKYNIGITPQMFFNIIGVEYKEKSNRINSYHRYILNYRKLGY